MAKVAFHNLGCKVNAYETEYIQQTFLENGYEVVPFTEKADVYVINTCSVTNMADHKSRQMLNRAKRMNPDAVVIATGCYVQTDKDGAMKEMNIDLLVGNNQKKELFHLYQEYLEKMDGISAQELNRLKGKAVLRIEEETEYEEYTLTDTNDHTRAYIKIQDGCNQFCSYCIIPYARGRIRSRKMQDVLHEIEGLAKRGFHEVVLTGIHLSSYGKKKGEPIEGNLELVSLIEQISAIDNIDRIRLGSLEPRIITPEFLQRLADNDKFCPHFHLSLQSGCDSVLKRMNRHYTADEYYEKVQLIREYFEHPALTTDVIVGFPGETEEEFRITREFLNKVNFYEVHVFKYSRRRGTAADKMPDQIPEKVKTERSNLLIQDSEIREKAYREWYIGKEVELLVEEDLSLHDTVYQTGFTREYVKVAVKKTQDMTNRVIKGTAGNFLTDVILEFSYNLR